MSLQQSPGAAARAHTHPPAGWRRRGPAHTHHAAGQYRTSASQRTPSGEIRACSSSSTSRSDTPSHATSDTAHGHESSCGATVCPRAGASEKAHPPCGESTVTDTCWSSPAADSAADARAVARSASTAAVVTAWGSASTTCRRSARPRGTSTLAAANRSRGTGARCICPAQARRVTHSRSAFAQAFSRHTERPAHRGEPPPRRHARCHSRPQAQRHAKPRPAWRLAFLRV